MLHNLLGRRCPSEPLHPPALVAESDTISEAPETLHVIPQEQAPQKRVTTKAKQQRRLAVE